MNFDLSATDFDLIMAVADITKAAGYPARPGAHANSAEIRERLRTAAGLLAGTGYLSAGIDDKADAAVKMMAAMQAFAAADPDTFFPLEISTRVVGRIVAGYGQAGQRKTFLDPIVNGRSIAALALCEKTMNIVNEPLRAEGRPDGDQVLVSAKKQYVVNGPVADWIAVVGNFQEASAVFLIPRGTQGLACGEAQRVFGKRHLPMGTIVADNCRIPVENVIAVKKPGELLGRIRLWENQVCIAESVGLMKAALETAKTHAKSHVTGEKPLIAYQEVAFKLAEMLTLVQTSELMSYKAVWLEASGDREAFTFNDCAKVFCTESAETVAGSALNILAGSGLSGDNPAETAWLSSKYCQVAGTSSEIARVQIGDATL